MYGKETTGKKQGQFTGQKQLNEATQDSNTKSNSNPSFNHKSNCSVISMTKVEREFASQTKLQHQPLDLAPRLTATL